MNLPNLWFVIVAVFWVGFFVLEGFDFGVGILTRLVGRTEVERRMAVNAIGPTWDGNEVWLIVAGAAMFAAFPGWYATWFSALYLALVVALLGLIVRGVSFEFSGKVDDPRWRGTWGTGLVVGSVLVPLLLGVGLGDLLVGLPVDSQQEFTGTFWSLLTSFGLVYGVTIVALCVLHGATFLTLKADDPVRARAQAFAHTLRWVALAFATVAAVWTYSLSGKGVLSTVLLVLIPLAALAALVLIGRRREGAAFAATAMTVGSTIASIFAGLYPNVLISSTSSANNLTILNTASQQYALTVMSWVALVLFPVVLLYQGWTYYVFRRRVMLPVP